VNTEDSASLAVTPLEKLEAVREWVESGIATALDEDPSGFLLGCESASVHDQTFLGTVLRLRSRLC
jgi:hypothetical protein